MIINKVKYDEDFTNSLQTMDGVNSLMLFNFYKKIREAGIFGPALGNEAKTHVKMLDVFKQVFGKQQTCKNYSSRNWIWTFTDGTTNLWCLISKDGLTFEYDTRTPNLDALIKLTEAIMLEIFNFFKITPPKVDVAGVKIISPIRYRHNGKWTTSSSGPR
jgi:hypothetical protein